MKFDVWEFPESCKKCGHHDNNDPTEPIAYLDANTKLCEFCFEDEDEENMDLEDRFEMLMNK